MRDIKYTAHNLCSFEFDESQHPRAPAGEPDGGQFIGADGTAMHPDVVNVGGDSWNQATAIRLEQEFQKAKPELSALIASAAGQEIANTEYTVDWESLDIQQQESITSSYVQENVEAEYDFEIENWRTDGAQDDAAHAIEQAFLRQPLTSNENQWASDALKAWAEEHPGVPYSIDQLAKSITVLNMYGEVKSGVNKDLLGKPDSFNEKQLLIPGIDAPEHYITDAQAKSLSAAIKDAALVERERLAAEMEPPSYLYESAHESVTESFNGMSDKQKLSYAVKVGAVDDSSTTTVHVPDKYDPLQTTDGRSYKDTQSIATYVPIERAAQLIGQRGVASPLDGSALNSELREADNRLWHAWVGSSTSPDGWLLQVATAEELGGRLREHPGFSKDDAVTRANDQYNDIGGYDGVKALVRAKWETTQYMLEQSGNRTVDLYRGISMDGKETKPLYDAAKANAVKVAESAVGKYTPQVYEKLPTLHVERNGASSMTTSRDVANNWGSRGTDGRVTLRARVPRTAVLSVPAYGKNEAAEKEVVVAGTGWGKWDAYAGSAPAIDKVSFRRWWL